MSTNYKKQGVENFSRRKWDVDEYEKKAKARQQQKDGDISSSRKRKEVSGDGDVDGAGIGGSTKKNGDEKTDEKQEFVPAELGAAGPDGSRRAFLKARKSRVDDIEDRIGTTEMISAERAAGAAAASSSSAVADKNSGCVKTGVGWHCKVCDCFLKDSHTYLDHINGRKHQRHLGYSMRVERTTKNQLLTKLTELTTKKKESESKHADDEVVDQEETNNYDDMVAAKDEEERRRKEERKRRRKERKKKLKQEKQQGGDGLTNNHDDAEEEGGGEEATKTKEQDQQQQPPAGGDGDGDDDEVEAEIDPALAQMMGFTGFGGSSKS